MCSIEAFSKHREMILERCPIVLEGVATPRAVFPERGHTEGDLPERGHTEGDLPERGHTEGDLPERVLGVLCVDLYY
jgi:hypothetical protein